MDRPLDVLGKSIGKKVLVQLRTGERLNGTLKAFDQHINLWIDDATLDKYESVPEEERKEEKLGKVLIRGDTVIFVAPAK